MAVTLLDPTDYPAVRAALDTSLSKSDLPDEIVEQSIYKDAAIQDVLALDEDALSRTDADEIAAVQRAAIFFCAARLAPAVAKITALTVTTRDLSYQKPAFDPEARAEELRELAADEIGRVVTVATRRPTMFYAATGTRGR